MNPIILKPSDFSFLAKLLRELSAILEVNQNIKVKIELAVERRKT